LESIQKTSDPKIKNFYTSQGSRSEQRIMEGTQIVRSVLPVTKDVAVVTSAMSTVQMLTKILAELNTSIEKYEQNSRS
jgi:hypothetical protein